MDFTNLTLILGFTSGLSTEELLRAIAKIYFQTTCRRGEADVDAFIGSTN